MSDVEARKAELHDRLQQVADRLNAEVCKLKLDDIKVANIEQADCVLSRDPASGGETLNLTWRNEYGFKCGEMLFHADGSFFAEYDVVRNHPDDKRWFVEAVTAWGRDDSIKSEPRLIPAVQ